MIALHHDDRYKQLLDDARWAPGERLRLLAPIGALPGYFCHPKGMCAHYISADNVESFAGSLGLVLCNCCTALSYSYTLANGLRSGLPEGGNRELEAALRTAFDYEKTVQGAHRVLATLTPLVVAGLPLHAVIGMFYSYSGILKAVTAGDPLSLEVHLFKKLFLGFMMQKLAAGGPQAALELDNDKLHNFSMLTTLCRFKRGTPIPPTWEALPAAARCAREAAAAASGDQEWVLRFLSFGLHALKLLDQGLGAMDDATATFLELALSRTIDASDDPDDPYAKDEYVSMVTNIYVVLESASRVLQTVLGRKLCL